MTKYQKISLLFLRLALGWFFFYAGINQVLDLSWSAAGYLKTAKTFSSFYLWLSSPEIIPFIDFVNKWSLTLLGLSLIFGLLVRFSSVLGCALMLLYYLPILDFPYVKTTFFLVDQHIIYILVLIFFAVIGAGRIYGLDNWCSQLPVCKKFPKLHKLFG